MLFSSNQEIRALRMKQVRGRRPTKCEAFVDVDNVVVIKLADGKWWSTWRDLEKRPRDLPCRFRQLKPLLTGLHLLGLLSGEAMESHLKQNQKALLDSDRRGDEWSLRRMAKKYRFRMPKLKPPGEKLQKIRC